MTRKNLDVLLRAVPVAFDRAAFALVLEQVGTRYADADVTVTYHLGQVSSVTLTLKVRTIARQTRSAVFRKP